MFCILNWFKSQLVSLLGKYIRCLNLEQINLTRIYQKQLSLLQKPFNNIVPEPDCQGNSTEIAKPFFGWGSSNLVHEMVGCDD